MCVEVERKYPMEIKIFCSKCKKRLELVSRKGIQDTAYSLWGIQEIVVNTEHNCLTKKRK